MNAVEPLLLQEGGVWVAAAAGDADRHAIERAGGLQVPPDAPRYRSRRVWLSDAERQGYYDGFANGTLWPLCHRTPVAPVFDATEFGWYETVNRRFADAVADEAVVPNPIVFAHDYHFALAPSMVRRRLPLSRIATFWHIPWPTLQLFDRCPWSTALIRSLLASTLIGFQTAADRLNFMRCAQSVGDIDWDGNAVDVGARRVPLGVYPASVDWPGRHRCRGRRLPTVARKYAGNCRSPTRRFSASASIGSITRRVSRRSSSPSSAYSTTVPICEVDRVCANRRAEPRVSARVSADARACLRRRESRQRQVCAAHAANDPAPVVARSTGGDEASCGPPISLCRQPA